MNKKPMLAVFGLLLVPGAAFAYGSYSADEGGDHLGVSVEYDNLNVSSASDTLGQITSAASVPIWNLGGTVKAQDILLNLNYRASNGFWLKLFGGMAMNGQLAVQANITNSVPATSVTNTIDETWNFNSVPTYGAEFGFNLFPDTWVHLVPSIRWQQTQFNGTAGTVYNSESGETDTYGSSSTTTSGYQTIGGIKIDPGSQIGSISTSFAQTLMDARIALTADVLRGDGLTLTVGGGVEETLDYISGTATHAFTGFTFQDIVNLGSTTQTGYFALLNVGLGPVSIEGEAHFTAEKLYVGRLAYNF